MAWRVHLVARKLTRTKEKNALSFSRTALCDSKQVGRSQRIGDLNHAVGVAVSPVPKGLHLPVSLSAYQLREGVAGEALGPNGSR
jgi:hypothetical protein